MSDPAFPRLRKALPKPLRRFLRLGRLAIAPLSGGRPAPAGVFAGCQMAGSRDEMLAHLPKGGVVAEVGCFRGDFARCILAATQPAELHLLDLDFAELFDDVRADPRARLHRGDSGDLLATFPDAHFDWIYIDADHSYRGVARDAAAAAAKLKPGGYLAFNDFAHIDPDLGAYGVHRAVMDFVAERPGWRFAWFAYEPNGLYDVALRKPATSS